MKVMEAQPEIQRDISTFKENIGNIKSVEDLMKDRRVLGVVLSSFQLESEIDKTAMIKKMLTEDPNGKDSLVNKLVEPRWKKLATALYGLNQDPDFFQKQGNVDAILAGYKTNEYEKFEGKNADGVREALYFKRLAGNVTSIPQILADKTLMEVVRVGLGLPKSFQSLDYTQQRARLEKQVNVEDFKDPAKIDKMIQRYLVYTQINNSDPANNPILSLFQPISTDTNSYGPQPIQIDLSV